MQSPESNIPDDIEMQRLESNILDDIEMQRLKASLNACLNLSGSFRHSYPIYGVVGGWEIEIVLAKIPI